MIRLQSYIRPHEWDVKFFAPGLDGNARTFALSISRPPRARTTGRFEKVPIPTGFAISSHLQPAQPQVGKAVFRPRPLNPPGERGRKTA